MAEYPAPRLNDFLDHLLARDGCVPAIAMDQPLRWTSHCDGNAGVSVI
ncbi:hypothetical protein [Pontixanthobacter sp.]